MLTAEAKIKFKTTRIENEFKVLKDKNNELYQLVTTANNISENIFNKSLVITEIYRTQKEQDRYYKGKPKFTSPHQRWLAVDIRSKNLTKQEIKALTTIIKHKYNPINTYIPTAFYHDVGLGPHIHIQFKARQ